MMSNEEFDKHDLAWMNYLHTPADLNVKDDISGNFKLGVVGYSATKFDIDKARDIIQREFSKTQYKTNKPISVVSGLTDIGIPGIAYHVGDKMCGMHTVGIACSKAEEYECYPVDEKHIIGTEWGDESEFFIDYIDALIRVGGGEQSHKEVSMFKEKYPNKLVIEIELPEIS